MKKQQSIIFLLSHAILFATSVHANFNVLVAEVDGVYHPLSLAGENNDDPPIDSNQFIWGNFLGFSAIIIKHGDWLRTISDADAEEYVKLSESGLVTSNDEADVTTFIFDEAKILSNHILLSCPNDRYHTLQTKKRVNTAKLASCKETKLHYLPFAPETGNIALPEDGENHQTKTSLSLPEKASLALFTHINSRWNPLTVDFNGQDKGQLPFVYESTTQRPIEFHYQNGQLVSSFEQVPGFACFESSLVYFSSKECSKETSYISYYKLKNKEFRVCSAKMENYCEDAEVQLFYLNRLKNSAITDKEIEIPSADLESKNDDNESSQHPLKPPKTLMVFAVKKGDSFTPLTYKARETGTSMFNYGEIENPPKFEYWNGIATTKDTNTPGSVQINNIGVHFGAVSEKTTFTFDGEGKVNHDFLSCKDLGKSSVNLFTTEPLQEYFDCTTETVYFLPYDKVMATSENDSRNQASNGVAMTQNQGPTASEVDDLENDPPEVDTSKDVSAFGMVSMNNNNHSQKTPKGNTLNGQHDGDQENHDPSGSNPGSSSGSDPGSSSGSNPGSSSGSDPGSSSGSDPGSSSGSDPGSNLDSHSGSKKESTEKSNMPEVTSKKKSQKESENSGDSQEQHEYLTTRKTDVDSTNPAVEGNKRNKTVSGKTEQQPEVNMDTEKQSDDRKGESVNTKTVEENKAQNPKTKTVKPVDQPQTTESESMDKSNAGMVFVPPVRVPKVSRNETGIPSPKVIVSGTNSETSGMEVGTSKSNTKVLQPKEEKSGSTGDPESKPEILESKLESSESVKVSSEDPKVFPESASKPKKTDKSKVSVPGTSESKAIGEAKDIAEDTKECTHCNEEKSSSDTLNNTLNDEGVSNLNGNSTTSSKANSTTTVCTACQHGSQTTVWKTYTDYTTYCPQETTLTITKCDKECVPSTMTVAAASTLTVTGVCIVPETTTVETGKEHSEEEGRLNGGGKSEQKINVDDRPSQKDGQRAHDQKDSFGQNEGSKASQPKASNPNQPKYSKLKAENNVKDEDNSGNGSSGNGNSGNGSSGNGSSGNGNSGNGNSGNGSSGNGNSGNGSSGNGNSGNGNSGNGNSGNGSSGNGNSRNGSSGNGNSGNGNSGTSGNSRNSAIGEKAIEPFVNSASKNALGACIVAFAALLL